MGEMEVGKSERMDKSTLFKDVGDFLSLPHGMAGSPAQKLGQLDTKLGKLKPGRAVRSRRSRKTFTAGCRKSIVAMSMP
jgi:hypothetical protein